MSTPTNSPPAVSSAKDDAMFDVTDLAEMLKCSARHVYRMIDLGLMPPPARLGRLVRWPRRVVLEWICAGCPRVAK
jgi:excisionase family DNA binding protein